MLHLRNLGSVVFFGKHGGSMLFEAAVRSINLELAQHCRTCRSATLLVGDGRYCHPATAAAAAPSSKRTSRCTSLLRMVTWS